MAGVSNRRAVEMEWLGDGLRFRGAGSEPVTPDVILDGDSQDGPSPTQALLLAAGGCAGADVVHILTKMRQPPSALRVSVSGIRRQEDPRRFMEIHFRFEVQGEIERAKVEHAVKLSVEKYCSVLHSLAPDITVRHDVEVA